MQKPDMENFNEASLDEVIVQASPEELFNNPTWTKIQSNQIGENLNEFVESIDQSPSYFDKAARLWSKTWWLQLIIALALIIPPLVVGILFSFWTLIALSVCLIALYAVFTLFFCEHHIRRLRGVDAVEQELGQFSQNLEIQFDGMDSQIKQIAKETDDFQKENERLAKEVDSLESEVASMQETRQNVTQSVQGLTENNRQLVSTNTKLEQSCLGIYNQLSVRNGMIETLGKNCQENEEELRQITSQLEGALEALGKELEKQTNLSKTFEKQVASLLNTSGLKAEDKAKFEAKLTTMKEHREQFYQKAIQDRDVLTRELHITQQKLRFFENKIEQLVNREEVAVGQLEKARGI